MNLSLLTNFAGIWLAHRVDSFGYELLEFIWKKYNNGHQTMLTVSSTFVDEDEEYKFLINGLLRKYFGFRQIFGDTSLIYSGHNLMSFVASPAWTEIVSKMCKYRPKSSDFVDTDWK